LNLYFLRGLFKLLSIIFIYIKKVAPASSSLKATLLRLHHS